jgi:hypothetical protein
MRITGNAASDPSGSFPEEDPCFIECTFVQTKDQFDNDLKTKEKGYPYWTLELTVTEGQSKGRKMWHNLIFIPPGMPGHGMALRCLHAFGLPHEGEIDIEPDDFYRRTASAAVAVETYKSKPRNVIARWHTPEETSETQSAAPEQGDAQAPGDAPGDTQAAQPQADKLKKAGFGVAKATMTPKPAATTKPPLWGGRKK